MVSLFPLPFTPRLGEALDSPRGSFRLTVEDAERIMKQGRTLGPKGQVTDQTTGKRYAISGAACDLRGCVCDSIATEVD